MSDTFRHCDEYIDDATAHPALRAFLERARSPGHGMTQSAAVPKLFATYDGADWLGIAKGDRVRVVMASRLGDVGITKNMQSDYGYQVRCAVSDLVDFGDVS